jgi:two-component system response regulator AlgR
MKLRVLVVDDEPPARELLRSLLAEIGDTEFVGEAATGEAALQLAVDVSPDVVLLDVRMPGIGGIETARQLNSLLEPPAVIFTTAYDEYAVNAFDAQAVGYLLKPIRKEKLADALTRAGRLTRPQLQTLAAESGKAMEPRTHVAARHREGLRLIPLEEILFFSAEQKYTVVNHGKGTDLIEDSLRALEEEFGSAFVRIHRNALVSVRFMESIERNPAGSYFVRLRGCEAPLPVSRRMAGELRERFRI